MNADSCRDELSRLTETWRSARVRLRERKCALLSEGKDVSEIRGDREYRAIRKEVKELAVLRRHCNARLMRCIGRVDRHE
jgi:hypothetical protein